MRALQIIQILSFELWKKFEKNRNIQKYFILLYIYILKLKKVIKLWVKIIKFKSVFIFKIFFCCSKSRMVCYWIKISPQDNFIRNRRNRLPFLNFLPTGNSLRINTPRGTQNSPNRTFRPNSCPNPKQKNHPVTGKSASQTSPCITTTVLHCSHAPSSDDIPSFSVETVKIFLAVSFVLAN